LKKGLLQKTLGGINDEHKCALNGQGIPNEMGSAPVVLASLGVFDGCYPDSAASIPVDPWQFLYGEFAVGFFILEPQF
jgi:hypothetical protein